MEDQTLFRDRENYIRNNKLQDYHDMMSQIFKEMKNIRDSGGLKLTLDFGDHGTLDMIDIPVIQFIIGDCKDKYILYGRKGSHSLNKKGLCRDCNISRAYEDNTYIGSALKCDYITINEIVGQKKDHIEKYSFLPINTCFTNISFGGCLRDLYGGIPADKLHAIILGLCK